MDHMESGFEEQSKKLEKAMNNLVEDLDKTHLRRLHADMHSCAARCCLRKDDSLEKVYGCVEHCRTPVDHAWSFVEGELQGFHDKLSQCLDTCSTKNKWLAQPVEQLTRSTKDLEDCSNTCVETMIKMIPTMLDKMKHNISRYNSRLPQTVSHSNADRGASKR